MVVSLYAALYSNINIDQSVKNITVKNFTAKNITVKNVTVKNVTVLNVSSQDEGLKDSQGDAVNSIR